MTYNPSAPIHVNPDPRILTIIIIGTPEHVETYIFDQYLCDYAETYEWSKPQPVPGSPGKVIVVLNRIMPEGR